MSAVLREAADRLDMRVVSDPSATFAEEWKALAAWLRAAAEDREMQPYVRQHWDPASLAVANAILGRDA